MHVKSQSDAFHYFLGLVAGILAGIVHVSIQDPLVTALIVLAVTMILGYLRPAHPWRWTLLVGLMVPLVMILAWKAGRFSNFTRAGLFGSALVILPGFAGAYGGYFGQRLLKEIFSKEK